MKHRRREMTVMPLLTLHILWNWCHKFSPVDIETLCNANSLIFDEFLLTCCRLETFNHHQILIETFCAWIYVLVKRESVWIKIRKFNYAFPSYNSHTIALSQEQADPYYVPPNSKKINNGVLLYQSLHSPLRGTMQLKY